MVRGHLITFKRDKSAGKGLMEPVSQLLRKNNDIRTFPSLLERDNRYPKSWGQFVAIRSNDSPQKTTKRGTKRQGRQEREREIHCGRFSRCRLVLAGLKGITRIMEVHGVHGEVVVLCPRC